MPEEHNRRLTDHLATLLLTHSLEANHNLATEGIAEDSVSFVGNTMIDSLRASVAGARSLAAWRELGLSRGEYVLVTLHRPALVDQPDLFASTVRALVELAMTLPVVFPVHPRTRGMLDRLGLPADGLILLDPLPYRRFLSLEADAAAVVTDSGGVQEETTALGVPCFTLRENTERPVTVTHGTNTVLGLDPSRLAEVPGRLLERRRGLRPPLWDGQAGERAATEIERRLGIEHRPRRTRSRDAIRFAAAAAGVARLSPR
jgi:UDP-N-acetylglucosamine 2-epimerase (non-hydrolysing)